MAYHVNKNAILYEENGRVLGKVEYPSVGADKVDICHTWVSGELRGRGVASRLVEMAARELRRTKRKARVTCSYAAKWLAEHPEYADVLDEGL